ncbi:F510_1955 family glycosylhydrolase [Nocardioides perillae]|uniref:Exo-alpha-sialidase n=1 Tax=Nocardioides perillae TaxID=1119534 RepID=A0A7Y9RUW3_9ACTN|nr:exo-alpha-sialidase [Nocardioides perillae]NYG55323.1 hypothetical protein [Nocardioides perillae]
MPKTPPAQQSRRPSPTRDDTATSGRRWLPIVVLLAVVALAGWLVRSATDGASGGASADLEHVHGLGVDPADDTLHVGSHYGLFQVQEDSGTVAGPIADRVQDYMGFTVAGPDHFLASGHPGEGQDGPSSLGLIESTDGGRTWTTRSLAGEADFHALEYRHGLVYGANAMTGDFMVSDDMETWDTRSTLPLADFAISPTDPDTIIATTGEGPALSTDGGRTFALVEDAPLLLLVSWAEEGTLVGLDPSGIAYASADGSDFDKVGSLGAEPEALQAADDGTVYASASGRLYRSTDGARTFARYPSA